MPKTVLRGGYGIFYGSIGTNKTNSNLAGFSRSTPIQATLDNGLTYIASLDNPFPTGLLQPLGAAGGMETNLGQGVSFFPENRKQPYSQKWSFSVQQQFPQSFVVESSYVGNRATRIPVNRQMTYTPAQYLSTSPTRDQATINYLSAAVPNPFFGIPQVTGQGTTVARQRLLQQYPHFSGVTFLDHAGYSWYHSMQNRVEKRFSKGYTMQLAYTWSKAMEAAEFMNASDPMPYESLSGIDRTHRLTGSGQWELPYGRKRKWGADSHPVLNFVVGGWQLNGIFQRQSGAPLGFGQALFTGDTKDIVLPKNERGPDRWFNTDVFYKVSAQALGSNIRTAPLRYSNIRQDSQRRWDFSMIKYFHLNETMNFQFRAETFNALNEPVLRGPNTDPYNTSFGRITSQEPPRSWQFSLRLAF
jgi:hypothetical protein